MLAAIGENLEDEDDNEVMGVVVNVRRGFYRIGLWTRSTGKALTAETNHGKARTAEQGKETLAKIGRRFKSALQLKDNDQVEFSGHADAQQSGSTRAKAKFVV